jgi:hypothetical protein
MATLCPKKWQPIALRLAIKLNNPMRFGRLTTGIKTQSSRQITSLM